MEGTQKSVSVLMKELSDAAFREAPQIAEEQYSLPLSDGEYTVNVVVRVSRTGGKKWEDR